MLNIRIFSHKNTKIIINVIFQLTVSYLEKVKYFNDN